MGGIFRRLGRALTTRPETTATGIGVEDVPVYDPENSTMENPKIRQETRLKPVSVTTKGAPAWLSGAADFLTALGPGGPEVAQRQQVLRQRHLGELAERALAPQIAQAQAQMETRRLRAMELDEAIKRAPKTTVLKDLNIQMTVYPETGEVEIDNLRDPEAIRKRLQRAIQAIEDPRIRGQAAEQAFGVFDTGDINGAWKVINDASGRESAEIRDATMNPTEVSLAVRAAQGDAEAQAALDKLAATRKESKITVNTEPGSFVPLTNERGVIVGAWNPKSGRTVPAPPIEGARKSGLPSEEIGARAGFETLINQFGKLEAAVALRPDAVGVISGRIGALQSKTIGGDPEAAAIYQNAQDISNQLVYLLSGKQINEQEYKRLRAALPTPDLPLDTFKVRMKNFKTRLEEVYKARTGKPLGDEQASGTMDGAPPPGAKVRDYTDVGKKRKLGQ